VGTGHARAYIRAQSWIRHWNKKLIYCWETARRESLPKITEMDVEMTTIGCNDLQMYFRVVKIGTSRKLVYVSY